VSNDPPIDVIEERQVDFYGDTILAILIRMDGETLVVVPVRPICQVLGIDWSSQRKRINRDDVLKTCVVILTTQVPGDTQRRDHACLPLDYLHGWLFGITTSQVHEKHRERISLYRRECFRALSAVFQSDLALPESTNPKVESGMTLAQVRDLGAALMQMAEQQMALEGRVDETHELATRANARLDKAAEVIGALQRRTYKLEDKLHPHAYITDQQAANVANAVKALAEMLTRQKGKNQYQGVYGELHRRFGVSSYTMIRQEQYDSVLAFLDDWYAAAKEGRERQEDTSDE
jgi:outer membrane murein-binding lipoprotein Lpp